MVDSRGRGEGGFAGTELPAGPGCYVVGFYDTERELARLVGGYLAEGLRTGESVIVVASAAHQRAFAARLAELRVDAAAASAAGRLLTVDAATTMRTFLTGDHPDPAGFEAVIGGLIQRAGAAGGPVRVYGEMVALLWEAGQVNAALEVEELWDDIGARASFSLLCAYPAALVTDGGPAGALARIRGLPSAVAGDGPAGRASAGPADGGARAVFPCADHAPQAARRFVLAQLRRWGLPAISEDAAIVVTELAANAVVHARSGFTVEIRKLAAGVRILVTDRGLMRAADVAALVPRRGHGLGLVAALASRWAAVPVPGGTLVWAELPARPAPLA
jgi:hypothetical protein